MSAWFEIVLSNVVLATALTAIAALAARLTPKRPALVHVLCVLALLKLVTPPLVDIPVLPAAPAALATLSPTELLMLAQQQPLLPAPTETAPTAWTPDLGTVLLTVWLLGSLLIGATALRRSRRFGRLLRAARQPSAGLAAEVQRLAAQVGLRRPPTIAVVDSRVSPMIWPSLRRLYLVLPTRLLRELTPDQRATLLLHELAHARRGDHWIRRLEATVSIAFWWLPTLWWLRRCLHNAEEQCCDAWVVWAAPEHERAYADALLSTIDFLSQSRFALPPHASGAGHVHQLKQRLTMIMEATTPRRLGVASRFAVLTVAVLFLPALPTRAQEPEKARSTKEENLTEALQRIRKLETLVERLTEQEAEEVTWEIFEGYEKLPPEENEEEALPKDESNIHQRQLDLTVETLRKLARQRDLAARDSSLDALRNIDVERLKQAKKAYARVMDDFRQTGRAQDLLYAGDYEAAMKAYEKAMQSTQKLSPEQAAKIAARQAEITSKVIASLKKNKQVYQYINPDMLGDNIMNQVQRDLGKTAKGVDEALRLIYSQKIKDSSLVDRDTQVDRLQGEIALLQNKLAQLQTQLKELQSSARKDL